MNLSVDLQHRFGGFALDIGFTAPPGVTALFGRSGAGKTTVVKAVAGLLRPQQGRIHLAGKPLLDTGAGLFVPPHRRRIGYVFQDARLFPHLSVRQNLLYGRWFAPKGHERIAFDQIIDLLGIGGLLARRPGQLSGGETSRVALGRAILSAPQLLLMDEPLAALDEARKAEILPYLERLRDSLALPILYVSHSPAEVARLATTVVLIEAGRVTAAGPAAEVLSDPTAAPGFGPREIGAVLQARVEAIEADGLARLSTAAGPIWLAEPLTPGRQLRLRILAQDVMLALGRPEGISALNILPAVVQDLSPHGNGILVRLRLGDEALLARITTRSAKALQLAPGLAVQLVLKAVAVAPEAIGETRSPPLAQISAADPLSSV